MANGEQTVRAMIEACCRRDLDAVLTHFHDDAIYHNIPIPPVQGLAAIRAMLAGFLESASEVDWKIHHTLANDDGLVMNERTDCFTLPAGRLELPVSGVFEVRDGKIAAWRDYFDMGPLKGFMGG
jgi:limonene-1,2-epoxide hydrolase